MIGGIEWTRLDRVISKYLSKTVKSDLRIERLGLNKIFHIVFCMSHGVCCLILLRYN